MRIKPNLRTLLFLIFLVSFIFLFLNENPFIVTSSKFQFSSFIPSDLLIEDVWYAIYFQDTFVGYSNFFMGVRDLKEGGGYILKTTSQLKVPILGVMQSINLVGKIKLSSSYRLQEANFRVTSKKYYFQGSLIKKDNDNYYLTISSPTQNIKKIVSIKNELIAPMFTPLSLSHVPLREKVTFSLYDPFLERRMKVILKNMGKQFIEYRGKKVKAYVIDMEVDDVKGKLFVDSKGRVLREEFLGFKFVKEEPTNLFKKNVTGKAQDLVQHFAIETGPLPNKENLTYLKIKVSGIPKEYIREDFNQKVYPQDDGFIVEIYKKDIEEVEDLPLKSEKFEKYLKEDEFIKFNSPLVKKILSSVVKDERNPLTILKKLSTWISENIKIVPTVSLPQTLDVLKMKQGDCGELSALLAGFLRGAGIPAYVNIGLVYMEGKFFYHAWVSLYVGEWIDTDPALNQLIADVTHIKLLEGLRSQFEIFKIIGNLRIKIIEYK